MNSDDIAQLRKEFETYKGEVQRSGSNSAPASGTAHYRSRGEGPGTGRARRLICELQERLGRPRLGGLSCDVARRDHLEQGLSEGGAFYLPPNCEQLKGADVIFRTCRVTPYRNRFPCSNILARVCDYWPLKASLRRIRCDASVRTTINLKCQTRCSPSNVTDTIRDHWRRGHLQRDDCSKCADFWSDAPLGSVVCLCASCRADR